MGLGIVKGGSIAYITFAALTIAVIFESVVVFENQLASARTTSYVSPSFAPTAVDRTFKEDRLRSRQEILSDSPQPPLPKGCELKFSSVRNLYFNEVPGRCVV